MKWSEMTDEEMGDEDELEGGKRQAKNQEKRTQKAWMTREVRSRDDRHTRQK